MRIECAGRLVGQNDLRIIHQRARDGNTLLLTARKLIGMVVGAVGQAHRRESPHGFFAPVVSRSVGVEKRQLYIFQCAGASQQIKLLEHKTDLLVPDLGQTGRD